MKLAAFVLTISVLYSAQLWANPRVMKVGDCKRTNTHESESGFTSYVSYELPIKLCYPAEGKNPVFSGIATHHFEAEKVHLKLCGGDVLGSGVIDSMVMGADCDKTAFSCDGLNGYLIKNARLAAEENARVACEERRNLEIKKAILGACK